MIFRLHTTQTLANEYAVFTSLHFVVFAARSFDNFKFFSEIRSHGKQIIFLKKEKACFSIEKQALGEIRFLITHW